MIAIRVFSRTGEPLGEINDAHSVNYSFMLNKMGQFTQSLPINHPKANPYLLKRGNIFVVQNSDLEEWSGNLEVIDFTDSEVNLTCFGPEHQLAGRLTQPAQYTGTYPGELFRRFLEHANQKYPTGINIGDVYSGGKKIDLKVGAENTYAKLTEMLGQVKAEYVIIMTSPGQWEMSLYEKRGSDLTGKVVVIIGHDTDGKPSYGEDWTGYVNSIEAAGEKPQSDSGGGGGKNSNDDGWSTRPKARYTDDIEVGAEGFREDLLEVQGVTDVTVLRQKAQEEVQKRKHPKTTLSFILNQRRQLWGKFQEGDIICVHFPYVNFTGMVIPYRVMGREISIDKGTMVVAGEVVQAEEAQSLEYYKNMNYGGGHGSLSPQTIGE